MQHVNTFNCVCVCVCVSLCAVLELAAPFKPDAPTCAASDSAAPTPRNLPVCSVLGKLQMPLAQASFVFCVCNSFSLTHAYTHAHTHAHLHAWQAFLDKHKDLLDLQLKSPVEYDEWTDEELQLLEEGQDVEPRVLNDEQILTCHLEDFKPSILECECIWCEMGHGSLAVLVCSTSSICTDNA